jgi:hypothetical protein
MKKLISIAILVLSFGISPLFSQTVEKESVRATTSEQFLSFVLQKAEKYSESVETGVSKAVDVIVEESPKVVEEFLVWRAWKAGFIGFGCLGIVIFGGGGLLFFFWRTDFWEASPILIFFIFPAVFACVYILEFIQIMVAPRVYIIEQAIQLVK